MFDTEPKIKSEPVEFNEFKNIFYNSKFTEDNIKVINNADIENDGLEVFFNGHESKFSDVKESILNKLNSTNLDALYIQVFFKTYDGKIHFQTYSLNNEQGRTIIYNLLRGEEYLDNDYYVDNSDSLVSVSDSNNTEGIEAKITPRMLTGFRITNKANENKKIINKVYCDNGGSFYIYKINEKYLSNVELIKKLERYQIFNDLKNKAFDVNCLVYSMIQTNLFSEAVINSMKATCYTRYISQKQLNEFGEKYEIAFNVIKFRDDKNDWEDMPLSRNWPEEDSVSGQMSEKNLVNGVAIYRSHLGRNMTATEKYTLMSLAAYGADVSVLQKTGVYNAFAYGQASGKRQKISNYKEGWFENILYDLKFNIVDENGKQIVKAKRYLPILYAGTDSGRIDWDNKVEFEKIPQSVIEKIENGKARINLVAAYLEYGEYSEADDTGSDASDSNQNRAFIKNFPEIQLSLEKLDYEILDAPIKILKYYSCKSIIMI